MILKMGSAIFRVPFQLAFAILLFVSGIAVIPGLVIVGLLLKLVTLVCARIFRKDLCHFVQGHSAAFAQDRLSSAPKMNIIEVCMFDGHIELEKLIRIFQERVLHKVHSNGKLMYPELQQYWKPFLNYMFWTPDPTFDVKNHVRLYDYGKANEALKLPNGICTENDLRRALGSLLVVPWKETQSPWELLLVQNFKSEQSLRTTTVVIFRIHHAMGDGSCIAKLLLRDMMLVPSKIEFKFPKLKWWENFGLMMFLPFKLPWDLAGSLVDAFDGNHCWHKLTNQCTLSRKVWTALSNPIDIEVVKKVKNLHGVGYAAVLCSVVAGASRRLMEDAGQLVPKEMSCFVPLPLPNHPDGLVNHSVGIIFRWPMDRMGGEERLKIIGKRMFRNKYSMEILGYAWLANILTILPNTILKHVAELIAYAAIAFSSFPVGPGAPEFVGLGVRVVDMFSGIGPGVGAIGIYMTPTSLNGIQRITVNIDQALFPCDRAFQKFAQYIDEELDALLFQTTDKHLLKNK